MDAAALGAARDITQSLLTGGGEMPIALPILKQVLSTLRARLDAAHRAGVSWDDLATEIGISRYALQMFREGKRDGIGPVVQRLETWAVRRGSAERPPILPGRILQNVFAAADQTVQTLIAQGILWPTPSCLHALWIRAMAEMDCFEAFLADEGLSQAAWHGYSTRVHARFVHLAQASRPTHQPPAGESQDTHTEGG